MNSLRWTGSAFTPGGGLQRFRVSRLRESFLKMLADMGLEFARAERPAPPAPRPARKPRYGRHTFQIMVADHAILRQMAKQAVWQEVGGLPAGWQGQIVPKGFKTQRQMNELGMGRTHWIGMPEWARGFGMNKRAICATVEKAIAGKRLGLKQLSLLKSMLRELDEIYGARGECPF